MTTPDAADPPGRPAVVLLSGGLDSAVALAVAQSQGFTPHALSFDYGQRHAYELVAAGRVARAGRVAEHRTVAFDLRAFGGSALTAGRDLPVDRSAEEMNGSVAPTYVPARNTIFLSFALAWAETLGATDVFLGVNAADQGGYPDCRPEYVRAYETMANLATRIGTEGGRRLTLHTPLIELTKAAIIRRGLELGVDFSLTSTCYDPSPEGVACGRCDACRVRRAGFAENGVTDPIRYRASPAASSPGMAGRGLG